MNFRFLDLHESASGFFPARTSRLISSSVRCEPSSCPVCNLLISVNSAGAEKLQQKSVRSLSQIFERHAPQLSICPAFMKENEPVVIFLFFFIFGGGNRRCRCRYSIYSEIFLLSGRPTERRVTSISLPSCCRWWYSSSQEYISWKPPVASCHMQDAANCSPRRRLHLAARQVFVLRFTLRG